MIGPDTPLGRMVRRALQRLRRTVEARSAPPDPEPAVEPANTEKPTMPQPQPPILDLPRLLTPHRYRDGCEWALTTLGICVDGGQPERTAGEPETMRRIWRSYGEPIRYHADAHGVPCELIMATITAESKPPGNAACIRLEPGYVSDEATPNKVSPGLMQTLLSTAREALNNGSVGRSFLLTPAGSIEAGTAYIARQKAKTQFDPPLVAAAYNAGGVYYQDGPFNRFKLRQYPIGTSEHVDRWIRWFNDALFVVREGWVPAMSFAAML